MSTDDDAPQKSSNEVELVALRHAKDVQEKFFELRYEIQARLASQEIMLARARNWFILFYIGAFLAGGVGIWQGINTKVEARIEESFDTPELESMVSSEAKETTLDWLSSEKSGPLSVTLHENVVPLQCEVNRLALHLSVVECSAQGGDYDSVSRGCYRAGQKLQTIPIPYPALECEEVNENEQ